MILVVLVQFFTVDRTISDAFNNRLKEPRFVVVSRAFIYVSRWGASDGEGLASVVGSRTVSAW
jgi:hypothetical protein